jgi:RNA polymerase sigma-70 factor (ECF subfamily)
MSNLPGMTRGFKLTAQSLAPPFGVNGIPVTVLTKLKKLEGKAFPTQEAFLAQVATLVTVEEFKRNQDELVKRADTIPRLILHFSTGTAPELLETRFYHAAFAPRGRHCVRGKDEGAHAGSASFQWSAALKVLTAYLLACAASARRCTDASCPILTGERSSAAASLNFAMSKKPDWIKDMFGRDSGYRPYLLDLIKRSNPDLKRKGPVVLCLDARVLPPQRIFVFVGDRQTDAAEEIEQISNAIEKSFKPSGTTKARFELTITGDLETDWSPDLRRVIEERLAELKIKNSQIIAAKKGSIKLLLELPAEQAERLFWAVHSGEMDDLGVIGGVHVRSPTVTSHGKHRLPDLTAIRRASDGELIIGFSLARYREYLLALATAQLDRRLRAKVEPSDIVQESLLKAHKSFDQFRGGTERELAAWLATILKQTLGNATRGLARLKRLASASRGQPSDVSFVHSDVVLDMEAGLQPQEAAQLNEQLLQMAKALERLPGDQRTVVELKHLYGLSVAEICERTGRSKPSVVGLLYRGIKTLRTTMANLSNAGLIDLSDGSR